MGRREEMVKLAQEMMKKKEDIRNIGIVAHIDHGKCVSADTQVFLETGELMSAKELFEVLSKKGELVKDSEKERVFKTNKERIKALSFNPENKRLEAREITHAWKMKKTSDLIKVKLSTGCSVTVTPEHRFLILNGQGKFELKRGDELCEGQPIVCPKKVEFTPLALGELKGEILTSMKDDYAFYITLESSFGKKLREEIKDVERIRMEVGSKLMSSGFRAGIKSNRYRLRDFVGLLEKFKIPLERGYNAVESINYRKSVRKPGYNSVPLKLPKTKSEFEDFFYLLGLIWGDGGYCGRDIRITNKSREIQCKVREIVKRVFGRTAKVIEHRERTPTIYLGLGKTFIKLAKIFEFPLKKKAYSITMPKKIQRAELSLLRAFVQGYFDSDGTVEESRRAVSIGSASKQMLEELQLNLLKFGVIATYSEKKNSLYISASNLRAFYQKIGFRLREKQKRLEMAVKRSDSPNQNTDLIPLRKEILRDIRKRLSIPQSALFPSYDGIESGRIPLYSNHLEKAINIFKQHIGNPKIKDIKAFEKLKELEKLHGVFFPQIKKIERIKGEEFVYDFTIEENHNFIANGTIVHNTTMTDSLIAAVGLMSEELAGKQLLMDFYELEQQRGITINAANISIVYKYKDNSYLVNIIDTPGHVDFGGDVIRAMRAVDGVIVLVDAVEGVMPQTETVIRQALRENCKPVLFVNKVDRLVNELKVSEDEMQEKLLKTIAKVNILIKKNAPKQFTDKWVANVEKGTVVFGSALYKWAISVPQMKETKISFKDVYRYCKEGKQEELSKKSPLYKAIMEMVVTHLPSPVEAQKYRIPEIWKGELESEAGKAMVECSSEGPLTMMVTDVTVDPHAGEIATGRVYSGTIKKGTKVFLRNSKREVNIQQVSVYMGPERVNVEEIPAGNIAALVGTRDVFAGETISSEQIQPFESFKSYVEPVMTISVEAKKTADLPKLIEVIKQITKEDPNVVATINQDTGEHLLSGMGELHLEVTRYRIEVDHNIPIEVSQPIVVYHETVLKSSPSLTGKSPNKHNQFKMSVEPMPKEMVEKLVEAKLEGKIRKKDTDKMAKLEEIGFSRDDAKSAWWVHNNCVLINNTRGIQAIQEIKELVCQGFRDAMDEGPLAKEKCYGVIVRLEDAKLHEDAIHRGPAQVLPAITRTIYACMLSANAVLLEPRQKMFISVPQDYLGAVNKQLQQRRATINEIQSEGDQTIVIAIAPVKELIGFSSEIRSATQGRAIWTAEFFDYKALPEHLQREVIKEVRTRKGMDPEPKNAEYFLA